MPAAARRRAGAVQPGGRAAARAARSPATCGASHASSPDTDIPRRVDGIVELLFGALPLAPRSLPGAAVGFAAARPRRPAAARLDRAGRPAGGAAQRAGQRHHRDGPRLWRLGERARDDAESARALRDRCRRASSPTRYRAGALPAVLQRGMAEFLAQYGHRAVAEIDLGMPRWSQRPVAPVRRALRLPAARALMRSRPSGISPTVRRTRPTMVLTLARRARRRGRLRAAAVRFCLRRARALVGMRETPKFLIITALGGRTRRCSRSARELTEFRGAGVR